MITLFESTSTEFTTNGLGNLNDAISCIVVEGLNGEYEIEMEYPITGVKYNDISLRQIIVAKPNPFKKRQPFRIYSITKPINGIVTINAEHISYDLSGYPAEPFTATSAIGAFTGLKASSILACPFTFYTDIDSSESMSITTPSSMRSILGGTDNSILSIYGGEYEFDNYSVNLLSNRGMNRGVSIRYGKNLTDLEQEENCMSVYTGVFPYWYSESEGLVVLGEKYINAQGTYNFDRILPLDMSQSFDEKPSEYKLRIAAQAYMVEHEIGVPKVSLTVAFIQLAQSGEYKNFALLENVYLGDTVNVEFSDLNVSATAKCVRTIYNVLTNKYNAIELGDAKHDLAETVMDQSQKIKEVPTKSFMEEAINTATKLITGGLGGHVVIHSSSGGGSEPDEILIMDTDDINTATKVWRWNSGGLGYSKTGYNGQYSLAMTMNGAIVASFITTGELDGGLIKAQTITGDSIKAGTITADKIEANKFATLAGLSGGNTIVSGDCITTGTVDGQYIKAGSISANKIVANTFATIAGLSGGNTIVSGDCITTGKVSASYIGPNNSGYITFTSPLLLDSAYPDISGIDTLYFSNHNMITDNGFADSSHGLTLSSTYGVFIESAGGLITSKMRAAGNLSIDAMDAGYNDYAIYIGTAKFSTNGSYYIYQTIQIGNDAGTGTINLYGTLTHNGYTVLNSNNISSYVTFR